MELTPDTMQEHEGLYGVLGMVTQAGYKRTTTRNSRKVDNPNQDRAAIILGYGPNRDMALFLLADGHGDEGEEWASKAVKAFPGILSQQTDFPNDIKPALKQAFVEMDEDLRTNILANKKFKHGGTTFTAALVHEQNLYVANVGDSSAVLGPPAEFLTYDHVGTDASERARVEKSDGKINSEGDVVVSTMRNAPVATLQMTRVIGDTHAKAKNPNVFLAEPHVTTHSIGDGQFLIVASDGLWDCNKTSDEIVQKAGERLVAAGAMQAAEGLMEFAISGWGEGNRRDDIALIVVSLNGLLGAAQAALPP